MLFAIKFSHAKVAESITKPVTATENAIANADANVTKQRSSEALKRSAANARFAKQVLSGRVVTTLDGSLTKCWAGGREGEKLRYQRDTLNFSLHSELFVRGNVYTGSLNIRHQLVRNTKLATPQFISLGGGSNLIASYMRCGAARHG